MICWQHPQINDYVYVRDCYVRPDGSRVDYGCGCWETSKQVAGACQDVARSIHSTFTHLGGKPEYVRLMTPDRERFPNMLFKLANGKDANVSLNGFHVAVRMNGRAYDSYTGASGLPWADYMSRLGARAPILEKVAESP